MHTAAKMPSVVELFTAEERASLRQVHEALTGREQQSTLSYIQNETILKSDKLFAFVEALTTVLQTNGWSKKSEKWDRLRELVKRASDDRKSTEKDKKWRTHVTQATFISMQWSLEVLEYYEWSTDSFGRDRLAFMYNCAKKYPRFRLDFVPHANLLRWLKHCDALSHLDKATEDNFAGFGGEFMVKDLKSLQKLEESKPTRVYGQDVTLKTAAEFHEFIERWTQHHTAVVVVGGQNLDLKKYRPQHWNTLLLKKDKNGLLVRRTGTDEVQTPRHTGFLSPPTSTSVTAGGPTALQPCIDARSLHLVRNSEQSISSEDVPASSPPLLNDEIGSPEHVEELRRNPDSRNVEDADPRPPRSHSSRDSPAAPSSTRRSDLGSGNESPSMRRTAGLARRKSAHVPSANEQIEKCGETFSSEASTQTGRLAENRNVECEDDGDLSSVRESIELQSRRESSLGDKSSGGGDLVKQECITVPVVGRAALSGKPHSSSPLSQVRESPASDEHRDRELSAYSLEHHGPLRDLTRARDAGAAAGSEASLRGIERWLSDQRNGNISSAGSPSQVASSLRSLRAPEGIEVAANETQMSGSSQRETMPHSSLEDAETVRSHATASSTSESSASGLFQPPSPAESGLPAGASQLQHNLWPGGDEDSSTVIDPNSGSATSPSPSLESSTRSAHPGFALRAPRVLRAPFEHSTGSSEASSPEDSTSDSSDFGTAWSWRNAGRDSGLPPIHTYQAGRPAADLSATLKAFAVMQPYAAARGSYDEVPTSGFASYIPHSAKGMVYPRQLDDVLDDVLDDSSVSASTRVHEVESSADSSNVTSSDRSEGPQHSHLDTRPIVCQCETCNALLPLLSTVGLEAASHEASELCRARDSWFGDATWASAAAPSERHGPGDEMEADVEAEVLHADPAVFESLADRGVLIERPIVITERQINRRTYHVESLRKAMRDSFGDQTVTTINTLTQKVGHTGTADFFAEISSGTVPVSSSTVCDSFAAPRPTFLSLDRFRLLHAAITRGVSQAVEAADGGWVKGCSIGAHSLCVSGGLNFNRIDGSGAFVGPCVDPLGGTWIRNLMGRRLCAFVPRAKMTTSLYADFASDRLGWQPRGEQRLVLLEPHDVLVLPPGIVCAQLAVGGSASVEGSFWDEREAGRYLTAAQWAATNLTHPTQIPRCAVRLALQGLRSIVQGDPTRFDSDLFVREFLGDESSAVFETVMAQSCGTDEQRMSSDLEDFEKSGEIRGRRMSMQEGENDAAPRPPKRMCLR